MSERDLMPDLTAYDRRWVTWEPRVPAVRPEPEPFDHAAALRAATEVFAQPPWLPRVFPIPASLTEPAARFWLSALAARSAADLETIDPHRPLNDPGELAARIAERLGVAGYFELPAVLLPLAHLFDPATLLELVIDEGGRIERRRSQPGNVRGALAAGYCDHVVPFLGAAEFAADAARVREAATGAGDSPATIHLHHLAAAFHLTDLVAPAVGATPRGEFGKWGVIDGHHLIYALGSRERVIAEMRRVAIPLPSPQAVREWFALTGRDGIAYAFRPENRAAARGAAWVEALGTVRCAETAAAMLALTTRQDVAEAAKCWLDRHPEIAVPAAAAGADAGTAARRDAAVATLKRAAALGHGALIERSASPELRAIVLGPVGDAAEIGWLFKRPVRAKPVRWLYADALPPLVVDGTSLAEEHVGAVIEALRGSSLIAPDARIASLRAHADPASAERFALALFHQWLRAGATAADKWALHAVGLLGGDEAATALVPYIRRWPGESQHARAVIGLECLRAIGSDVALTHVAGLAQKLTFAALKRRANECLEEIARERDLTRDRLEDRIVPTLDLERGARAFELRGEIYTATVDDGLAPVLHDAGGNVVRDLPKRTAAETERDAETREEWKLFKKQLREVARIAALRLEAAMVAQRSWFADEFATLLVGHPVVGRLVRRLVWIAESATGSAVLFRVGADGGALDDGDGAVALPSTGTLRIVHRLELTDAAVDAWAARLAAAGTEQPFAQLERVTYRLDDVELASDAIHRFDGLPVSEPVLLGRLRTRGWQRGQPQDGGAYTHHWKRFEKAGVAAILHHGMIIVGYRQPDAQVALAGCTFVRDRADPDPFAGGRLRLDRIPDVPLSEVCADCTFLLS
jgi:Domain of unknown function (DUF4132)